MPDLPSAARFAAARPAAARPAAARRATLAVALVALPLAAAPAGAQPRPAPQARLDSLRRAVRDTARIGAVRVVGVRTGQTLRSTGPLPVDRVPAAQVTSVGQQEVTQSLNFVVPSFYSVTQSQADGADHVDFAALRALGADQTLVLVNGRRRHTSALLHLGDNVGQGTAGVDLNALPAAALERVEVLRDGAAAQYGSDAIAGVMNFVLRSDVDAPRLSVQAGQTTRGDGQSVRADAYVGRAVRRLGDGRAGFVALTGELRYREPTQRVGRWNGNVYTGDLFNFGDVGPNGEYASEAEYQEDLRRQRERGFDLFDVQRIGDSRLANATGFLNAALPLGRSGLVGDSAEVYAFGGVTRRQGDATAFYRFPADRSQAVDALFPDGYLPRIQSRIWDGSLAAGVRGQHGAWRYDLGTAAGVNRFGFRVANTVNPSLGAASPTAFDAGAVRYGANTLRLDLARPLGAPLPGGRPRGSVNVGAEWRAENYALTAGEEGSWRDYGRGLPGAAAGSRGFPGYQPRNATDRWRNNVGAYVDAEANVTERLLLSAAARAEDYSDFGGRVTGKLAGLVRLAERAAVRGAVNTGFRAPSLHQAHTSKLTTIFVANQEVVSGLFANDDPVTRALGVGALRPETSVSWSGGLVLEPLRRLSVQADAYRIDVDDRIVASGVLGRGDAGSPIDVALAAFPGVDAVQFFTNAIDTRTVGLDAQLSYPVVTRTGVLTLTAAGNWTRTRIVGGVRRPAGVGGADLFNPQERSYIENGLPVRKLVGTARWQAGRWNALARTTHFGGVEAVNLFGPNEHVPVAYVTDAAVGATRGRYELSLGVNNLFDRLPPRQDYANSYFGIFQYARVAPYGIRGRFVYANLAARL